MKLVPIKKIFKIIDSCTNVEQLHTCKNIADLYTNLSSTQGVVNYEKIRETLYVKINEKKEELNLSFNFKGSLRSKRITYAEPEYEFANNF